MTASAGIEEALGKFQEFADEGKQKDATIDQLTRLTDELRTELEESKKNNELFAEYADIILNPDMTKDWQQITIRSGKTFADMALRCQQLFGNTRAISMASLAENIINYGVSDSGWRLILQLRYDQKPQARRILGLPPIEDE